MGEFLAVIACLMFASIPFMFLYLQWSNKKSADLVSRQVDFLSRSATPEEVAESIARSVSKVPGNIGAKINIVSANELGVVVKQSNMFYHWWEIRVDFRNHNPIEGIIYMYHAGVIEGPGVVRGAKTAARVFDAIIDGIREADPSASLSGTR